jgi:hypothetical protein
LTNKRVSPGPNVVNSASIGEEIDDPDAYLAERGSDGAPPWLE